MKAIATVMLIVLSLVVTTTAAAEDYVATYPYSDNPVVPSMAEGIADAQEQRKAPKTSYAELDESAGGYCRNNVNVHSSYSWYSPAGGIEMRLQVFACTNGWAITYCYRNRWVQRVDWPWAFVRWNGYQFGGGEGSGYCAARYDAIATKEGPFGTAMYFPWAYASLYAGGGYSNDEGGM